LYFIRLRQLILGSFVVALIPLAVLLWQTQQSFTEIRQYASENVYAITQLVEHFQQLERAMVSVERSIRQYEVLTNSTSQQLAVEAVQVFERQLKALCIVLPQAEGCESLLQTTLLLPQQGPNLLPELQRGLNLLGSSIDVAIKDRLEKQNKRLSDEQREQAVKSLLLASLSLLLILAGSQLVINPVSKMQRLISLIASQTTDPLPPLSRHAPKELLIVEQDLHWLSDRLAQLEHIRKALLRHAAHELKTPLASIKEGCSLLSDRTVGPLTEQQREVLHWLDNSVERLNLLIVKLLDYNQLLQQAKPTLTTINVEALIAQCHQDYQAVLAKHELRLSIDAPYIRADEELLRRILDNLLSNDIAHGAVDTPIDIKVTMISHESIIDVANAGEAISSENVDGLFEPFVRGRTLRHDNVVGAGLGLSIVADCVRLMHGRVLLQPVDYADVCFRVVIPQQDNT